MNSKREIHRNEALWESGFGDRYHERNVQTSQHRLWADVLRAASNSEELFARNPHIMELGAGQGDNLVALRDLLGLGRYIGVDINYKAIQAMEERGLATIHAPVSQIVAEHTQENFLDMVVTRGCLIHLPPEQLPAVYEWAGRASRKYVCFAEYYSPQRRELGEYHGVSGALWLADYAGEFMECNPNWRLVNYGFLYHGDGGYDETWFLMEKTA